MRKRITSIILIIVLTFSLTFNCYQEAKADTTLDLETVAKVCALISSGLVITSVDNANAIVNAVKSADIGITKVGNNINIFQFPQQCIDKLSSFGAGLISKPVYFTAGTPITLLPNVWTTYSVFPVGSDYSCTVTVPNVANGDVLFNLHSVSWGSAVSSGYGNTMFNRGTLVVSYAGQRLNCTVGSWTYSSNLSVNDLDGLYFKNTSTSNVVIGTQVKVDVTVDVSKLKNTNVLTPANAVVPRAGVTLQDLVGVNADTISKVGTVAQDVSTATSVSTATDTSSISSTLTSIANFFTIDWDIVFQSMDFSDIWPKHFKPFYDVSGAFQNIQNSPQNSGGKFYMKIPHEMGGDDQQHVVLDFTVGQNEYIVWAREIIKWAIWLAFGWYIIRMFEPKLNIG